MKQTPQKGSLAFLAEQVEMTISNEPQDSEARVSSINQFLHSLNPQLLFQLQQGDLPPIAEGEEDEASRNASEECLSTST